MIREKLTNGEISTLVEILNNHYTLPETIKAIIGSFFNTEEEIIKATLFAQIKLYRMGQLPNHEKDCKEVIIRTTSKLVVVKAVREILNLTLKEAKDLVDIWFPTPYQLDNGDTYTSIKIPLTSQLTYENMKAIEKAATITVIEFL